MRTVCTVVGLGAVSLAVACGATTGESSPTDDSSDFGELNSATTGPARTLTIPSSGNKTITFSSAASGDVSVNIDCNPPSEPDSVGPVFTIDAPTLHLAPNQTPKAGAFGWAGQVDAGEHAITLTAQGAGARCSVKIGAAAAGACSSFETYRSPNINHTHFAVGTDTSADWEPFPASGNHWGSWAAWNKTYATPVKRAFALHNLEHGGAVLSYKCSSNSSADCAAAEQKLQGIVSSMGLTRYIITPDADQPDAFAIRTWRWLYTSSCINDSVVHDFLVNHMKKGREDIDSDPPVPFDPTTTNVPCQDLMAAPDSCY